MSTPADEMFTWFAKEEHQVKVVQSLSVVSGKDKRKLRSKKYQEMNGIWGKAALMIFNENQEYQRFFLYTVWSEDKLRVQGRFDIICGRKLMAAKDVKKSSFCLCKKRSEIIDPHMVICSTCDNGYHCVCHGLIYDEVKDLPEFHCEYCTKNTAAPNDSKIPEDELHNYSFVQLNDNQSMRDFADLKLDQNETDSETESVAEMDMDHDVVMENTDGDELKSLHHYCEKLKTLHEVVEDEAEKMDLPLIFEGLSSDSDSEDEKREDQDKAVEGGQEMKTEETEPDSDDEDEDTEKYSNEEMEDMVPLSFKMIVPRAEWDQWITCKKTTIKLNAVGSKPAEEISVRSFAINDNYTTMMKKHFLKTNPFCRIRFSRRKIKNDEDLQKGPQVKMYTKCTRRSCSARYSFTSKRIPEGNEDMKFTVEKTGKIKHEDKKRVNYQLRGDERKKLKETLATQTAFKVQRALAKDGNIEGIKSGNYGFIHGLNALRIAKSEEKHKDDISADSLVDLVATQMKQKDEIKSPRNGVDGYLQEISLIPFKMLMFLDESLVIYNKLTKQQEPLTLIMDATQNLMSGLPAPLETARPFLYTVLVATSGVQADFPVCEFTSVRHTHADISGMLLTFFETYRRMFQDNSPFYGAGRFEIDFSKALLSSIINVFSKFTTLEYFTRLWVVCTNPGQPEIKESLFPIHVCRFHVLRFIKLYLLKCYPTSPMQKEILAFWGHWAYAFVYGLDMWSMHRRMRDLFVVAGSYYFTTEVQETILNIQTPTTRTGEKPWLGFCLDKPDVSAPFWKKSPFGQYSACMHDHVYIYSKFLTTVGAHNLSPAEKSLNPYYSQSLCNYFKVQIFPYYPILTRIIFQVFNLPVKDDTTNRCENHHSILKTKYHVGNLKQRPAQFIRQQCVFIQGGSKTFLGEIGRFPTQKTPSQKTASDKMPSQKTSSQKTTSQRSPLGKRAATPQVHDVDMSSDSDEADSTNRQDFRSPEKMPKTPSKRNPIKKSGQDKDPEKGSPESYEEKFKKPFRNTAVRKSQSVIKTYPFLKWGGFVQIDMYPDPVPVVNTCNIDNVLTVLHCLNKYSSKARNFFAQLFKEAESRLNSDDVTISEESRRTVTVSKVLHELESVNLMAAKAMWIKEFCRPEELWFANGCPTQKRPQIDLYEEERENGFRPISHWMKLLRRNKCQNPSCGASSCAGQELLTSWNYSRLPADTRVSSVIQLFRNNSSEMLHVLNEELNTKKGMETSCRHCLNDAPTVHYFPGGPPPVVFYALQGLHAPEPSRISTIPRVQIIQDVSYDLFAVSLHSGSHITCVMFDNNHEVLYNGLQSSYTNLAKTDPNPKHQPIVCAWLIQAD